VPPRDITTINLGRFRGRYRVQRAAIFIPDADAVESAARCLECAEANELQVIGVVVGDWHVIESMLRDGTVTIVVADSRTDLPPDREPRLLIVAEQPPERGPRGTTRNTRTTRIIRRGAAT
jgi:hypothetical protein